MSVKKLKRLVNSHFKDIINALALEFDIKRFAVVSFAAANLARNINISQKVHFDFNDTVALARLASAALDIKRKSVCLVAFFLRLGCGGKKVANIVENARICCRI